MKHRFGQVAALLLAFALLFTMLPGANAKQAEDISQQTQFSGTLYGDFGFLTDRNVKKYQKSTGSGTLELKNPQGISGIYLLFDLEYGAYTVTDNDTGAVITAGKHKMLHEYISLETPSTHLTVKFTKGSVSLSEVYVFSQGEVPDFVQKWDAPLDGKADMVLFAAHGDDDQLFFAGILPYYAAEKGYAVQVVYMTDHRNLTNARTHEMLNGLWAVGVKAYPVFGSFDDFLVEDKKGTYDYYKKLEITEEQLQSFVVEQIRRFRPQVAVGHDLEGEYKHGMHMVYADLLIKALDMTNDASYFPESAATYGLWDVPKTYLHLYPENKVKLNLDVPLESFDGMTAFEVTQKLGYPCHESQQYTWFTKWINWVGMKVDGTPITKASQIEKYSPCDYGLYRSLVGEDVIKDGFFENVVSYAEQARLEQEKQEQERLEQERIEQEKQEQERLEQERLEQERLEQERVQQEKQRQKEEQTALLVAVLILGVLVIAFVCVLVAYRNQQKRRRAARRRREKNIL